MTKFVDWDTESTRGKGDGDSQFLKLKAGGKYRVRLVGRPISYLQHWEPVVCRSPYQDEDGKVIDPLMLEGKEPKKRFSAWVLDREDGDKLKVMDFPPSLFDSFKEWRGANNNDEPGGSKGCDWKIVVTLPAGGDRRKTKYAAYPSAPTPFTEEELARMKEIDIKKKLEDYRKPHSPEEIRRMLAEKGMKIGGASPSASASFAEEEAPEEKPAKKAFDPKSDDPIDF